MLQYLMVIAALMSSSLSWSQGIRPSPLSEGFLLEISSCQLNLVDLKRGEMKIGGADPLNVACKNIPNQPFVAECAFFEKGKPSPFAAKRMAASIVGGEMIIEGGGDAFFVNITSQLFYAESNLILANGLMRGKRVCMGKMIWESEQRAAAAVRSAPLKESLSIDPTTLQQRPKIDENLLRS